MIEIRIVAEDEGTRWLRHYVHPVWDESQGRVVRFYGAAQDITERRITRAALEEHQTALNKAQELARMASFVWDVRDKAVTWSENMYGLLGIDRNELTGDIVDTYIQLAHPEDRERVHRQITER